MTFANTLTVSERLGQKPTVQTDSTDKVESRPQLHESDEQDENTAAALEARSQTELLLPLLPISTGRGMEFGNPSRIL